MRNLDSPLTPDDVESLYREFLERPPRPDEVEAQMAQCPTGRALIDIVRASEEYAVLLRARTARAVVQLPRVNVFHPDLAEWTHPPGSVSGDGTAIVGRDGWVFIRSGSNSTLAQHRGEQPPPARWLDAWMDCLAVRRREADELGVELVCLVVPDKLAIQEDYFPEPIVPLGPRPALRLCRRAGHDLLYPLDALRAARADGEVALRTDTHLSVHGNRVLAEAALGGLGVTAPLPAPDAPLRYLLPGDLGAHFDPAILEVGAVVGTLGAATLAEDNRREMIAVGAHVGTRRVLRNGTAPDPRVAVLIGDSYGFPDAYYQGLGWWLAQVFAELHFLWVPFGWDPGYLREVGARVAIVQTAERFVGRVPHDRVDARALARASIANGHGAGLDSFCRAV